MKKRHKQMNAGSAGVEAGIVPERKNTVLAYVLAELLAGGELTCYECWRQMGSNRLSHHIWQLHRYGRSVETEDISTGTTDGRVSTIAKYRPLENGIMSTKDRDDFIREVQRERQRNQTTIANEKLKARVTASCANQDTSNGEAAA